MIRVLRNFSKVLCVLIFFIPAQLISQCIDFQDLTVGNIYAPPDHNAGTQMFTIGDVSSNIDVLTDANGQINLNSVNVQTLTNPPLVDNVLLFDHAVADFDFSEVVGTISSVTFDFSEPSGYVNIEVNGAGVTVFEDFSAVDNGQLIGPSNQIFVFMDDSQTGNVLVNGQIESLKIGGQDLAIDNLCYNATMPPVCNLVATALAGECNGDGFFFADFLVVNEGPDGTAYQLFVDDELYGEYNYDQNAVEVGPLLGNGESVVLTAVDIDEPDCTTSYTILAPECPLECSLSEPYSIFSCNDGLVSLLFHFEYENTSDSFNLHYDGAIIGTYAYIDLPISLGPFPGEGQLFDFLVADQEDENCVLDIIIETTDCDPQCEISNFVSTDPVCNPNGGYGLTLDFVYQNPGNNSFDLFNANNELIGTYALSDLPLTLNNYEPFYEDLEVFNICINDQPDCCLNLTVLFPACNPECTLNDFIVEAYDCDPNGLFMVDLDLNYSNTSDSFTVFFNGVPQGTYAYIDLYITLGPFEGNGQLIQVEVIDQQNPNCTAFLLLEAPECNATCQISNIEVDEPICNPDGGYDLSIDFDYENPGNEFFDLFDNNGNVIGTYPLEDLPISVPGYIPSNEDVDVFIICINDQPSCCADFSVEFPACPDPITSCIEFEGLVDGLNYGGSNSQPGDLLMIENEVLVTLEGVPDPIGNLNYSYMFATTQDICNPFDAANGNRLFMFNGLKFDFTPLTTDPTLVSFPYHNCGIPFAISVNDQSTVTYLFPQSDTTFNLSPSVVIDITVDPSNTEEGTISLQGGVENFFIGGIELQIDNVCFNVENLVPEVWPGDANFDNIANNFDLLNIGIAFGSTGAERSSVDTDWFGMPAEDWDDYFADEETNFKHADCNGNGTVNEMDQNAILENYNLDHGPVPIFVQLPGTPDDPPFFVDLPEEEDIVLGEPFEAPIILGTEAIPIEEIYGIAFTIEFPVDQMDELQVSIDIDDSWMGQDGVNLIHLNRAFAPDGKIEVALTRINQENTTGFGKIANFIGIIDDILGRAEVAVTITDVKAIDIEEQVIPLYLPIEVIDMTTPLNPDPFNGDIEVYPNPTTELVHIDNQSTESIQQISIYNVLGQLMTNIETPSAQEVIQLKDWAAGVYIIKVKLESRTLTKRIKKSSL